MRFIYKPEENKLEHLNDSNKIKRNFNLCLNEKEESLSAENLIGIFTSSILFCIVGDV